MFRTKPKKVRLSAFLIGSISIAACSVGQSSGQTSAGLDDTTQQCVLEAKMQCPFTCALIDLDAACQADFGAAVAADCDAGAGGDCVAACGADCASQCAANSNVQCGSA